MQLHALTRLRLAFVVAGVCLLVPLGWLLHSVNQQLEAQRRLRHQVVAERIFDEIERELTRVLEREAARPSRSFEALAPEPRPERYAVAYFTNSRAGTQLLDGGQPGTEARQRASWALKQPSVLAAGAAIASPASDQAEPSKARENAVAAKSSLSSADVLRKLNRAQEERQQTQQLKTRGSARSVGSEVLQ